MRIHIGMKTISWLLLLFLTVSLCAAPGRAQEEPNKPVEVKKRNTNGSTKQTAVEKSEEKESTGDKSGESETVTSIVEDFPVRQPPPQPKPGGCETGTMEMILIWTACLAGVGSLGMLIFFFCVQWKMGRKIQGISREVGDLDEKTGSLAETARKQVELLEQVVAKTPAESGVASRVAETLKLQLEQLRKALMNPPSSQNDLEILTTVRSIKSKMEKELDDLRLKERQVHEQKAELDSEKSEMKRKRAEAEQKIANCENDVRRAVENVRIEVQTAMRKQFQMEEAKLQETIQQLREKAEASRQEILRLNTAISERKIQSADAESSGFERGVNQSIEKIRELERSRGVLSSQLEQAKTQVGELQQKLSGSEQEQKSLRETLRNQELLRENLAKQHATELSQINAQLTERSRSIAEITRQKQIVDQELGTFRIQLEKAREMVAAAERKASECEQRFAVMQTSVEQLRQEKEQLSAAVAAERASVAKLTDEKNAQTASLRAAMTKIENLQKEVYPAECLADPDFAILKEHLDSWLAEQAASAEIVKSSLGLFSQRAVVNSETWQLALRNISIGIAQTLQQRNVPSAAILAELFLWSKFLMKFSNEDFDFSLKIPNIGEGVDPAWMSVGNSRATKVSRVISWAVWNNQFGVMHNAEVE